MNVGRVAVLALLAMGCASENIPPSLPMVSLASFTSMAEQCVRKAGSQPDSLAARCLCRTLKEQVGTALIDCFATPYLLGFVGESVPLPPIRRSNRSYYGLAFAPRGLEPGATEQIEVFKYGYGVATAHPDLPAHWYLLTYCRGCD
jgi:hypothetical protein